MFPKMIKNVIMWAKKDIIFEARRVRWNKSTKNIPLYNKGSWRYLLLKKCKYQILVTKGLILPYPTKSVSNKAKLSSSARQLAEIAGRPYLF